MHARIPAWTSGFSQARWLDEKRVTVYSRLFVTIYALAIVIVLALSPQLIDPQGKPVGTDFLCFWTAGRAALEGHAVDAYDYRHQFAREQQALPWKPGQTAPLLPWLYPPMFMFAAAALALLPYGPALGAWIAVTLSFYLAVIRAILPGRVAIVAALAFPGVFSNLSHGQNGFLTTGLLGGAIVLLEPRPWISGVLFGLLAYKPQFALLIPLALLVGGYWRAIAAAALTVLGSVSLSWAFFGGASWRAFFGTLQMTRIYGLEQGSAGWEKIQSIYSVVRMFGGGIELAYAVQAVFAIAAAVSVIWIWRRPASIGLKGAALATAMLLATPYVLDYDLMILALPISWLAALGLREGFLPWEKITLFAAWMLPLLSRTLGELLHLPLSPWVMSLLLAITLRRALSPASAPTRTTDLSSCDAAAPVPS